MNGTGYFVATRFGGLTLIELLVAIVLSVLMMGLILPLLHTVMQKDNPADVRLEPTWVRALQADLDQIISPAKCALPVVQIVPASSNVPYDSLIIQTLSRPGSSSRGPMQATWTVEIVDGVPTLVRQGKGWHDEVETHQPLPANVISWHLAWSSTTPPPIPAPVADPAPAASNDTGVPPATAAPAILRGMLTVNLISSLGSESRCFWLDLPAVAAKSPTKTSDAEASDTSGDAP